MSGALARLGAAFWLSFLWVLLVVTLACLADLLPLHPYEAMDFDHAAAPPGVHAHILGTDTMGRDILARLIHGSRISLCVGLLTPLAGLVFGGLLGMLAGYYRGRAEALIMGGMDVILAFPGLVLLLAATFFLGPGLKTMIPALGILTIPSFARIARANTLALAGRDYIRAARMAGHSDGAILACEIIPNLITPLAVYALMVVSYMIVAEGSLSFLGLGVPAPAVSWGGMIALGREVLDRAAHVSLLPAAAMFLTVLAFNLMGDGLRALTDPRETRL